MGAVCSADAVHDDLRVPKGVEGRHGSHEESKNGLVARRAAREFASASGSQVEDAGSGRGRGGHKNGKGLWGNEQEVLSSTRGRFDEKPVWKSNGRVPPGGRLESMPENGELVSQVILGVGRVEEPCGVDVDMDVDKDVMDRFCKFGTIGHGAFYSLVSELEEAVVFEDSDFPAELSSLCDPRDDGQVKRFGEFQWKRPNEFFRDSFHLFLGNIEPNDIHQGRLGDCYFLSVLASLAEWPKRIRKMFASDKLEAHGCYGVHFCVRGEWRTVAVDDRFPCLPDTGAPAFSRGNGSEIWVMILEKAWAKLHGTYYKIEAGVMSDCLWSFTGAPVMVLPSGDESVWDLLLQGEKLDWIMNAGCTDDEQQVAGVGLVASHAYSLLTACELEAPQGTIRLVQLRNPWGYGEWTGQWSDNSKMWTQQLRDQLGGVHVSDDGTFFMSFSDFKTYFPSITVCKYFDNFSTTSVQREVKSGTILAYSVEVEEASHCYFTAHQDCMRFAPDPSAHKYSAVSVIVGRVGEYCAAKTEAAREVSVEVDVVPGTYYVWMRAFWEDNNQSSNEPPVRFLGFSTYSAKPTTVKEISKRKSENLFHAMYLDHARNNCVLEDYSFLGEPQCFKGSTNLQEGSYIYYQNKSAADLTEEIDFVQLQGLDLVPPYKGQKAEVSIPSGSEHLVLLSPNTNGIRSWAVQSWARFKIPVENLINTAKCSGNVCRRMYAGDTIDLMVYTYVHQSGAVYHFENGTEDMTWMETWTFDFENLVIVGHNDKCIQINIGPGASQTICFDRVGRDEWKLGASVTEFCVSKNESI